MHEPLGGFERLLQFLNRVKRFLKRRFFFMVNYFSRVLGRRHVVVEQKKLSAKLMPGDEVRVRSAEEIRAILGDWNSMRGCSFMEEMWRYCGTRQRVLKRVDRFLDERDYLVKKMRGIVILDHVNCQGTVDFGPCDRSCFFFWREEWLMKLEE
jgi:hypothetical protein